MTVSLLQEVCHDVCSEPHACSNYLGRSYMAALVSEVTMPDWMSVLVTFGVVDSNKHFSTSGCLTQNAPTNRAQSLQKHEQEKRRQYGERVQKVESSSFSPLTFSSCGGMGPAAISVWLPSSVISGVNSTVLPWDG